MVDFSKLARRALDATKGFRSFHSSPHDIDKFDISKIGTGQGAASYTPGLYFAENPKVSGQGGEYWQEFLRRFPDRSAERDAAEILQRHKFDRAKALNDEELLINLRHPLDRASHHEEVKRLLESNKPIGPRTYEVNINEDPNRFLDWDKTLAQQHPDVLNRVPVLADAARKEANSRALSATHQQRADELWGMVKDPMQAPMSVALDRLRHNMGPQLPGMMRDAGIPGVRYLDAGSRQHQRDILDAQRFSRAGPSEHGMQAWAERAAELQKTPLTRNTVVYDDKLVDILKRYGIAGGVAPFAGAAAMQTEKDM